MRRLFCAFVFSIQQDQIFWRRGLLIEQLRAYGLVPDAIDLLSSFSSDRVLQVRRGRRLFCAVVFCIQQDQIFWRRGLLIEKLRAYGLVPDAIDLLSSFSSDRVLQVRRGSHTSTWENILMGVPQGSILGPLLLNDMLCFIYQGDIYNYVDDNTLSFTHANIEVLKRF